MTVLSNAAKDDALDGVTLSHVSAYNGDPLAAGTEVATARVVATFGAASGQARALSGTPELTIPAAATVTHITVHDALTGGAVQAAEALASPEAFGAEGTLRITSWTITAQDV